LKKISLILAIAIFFSIFSYVYSDPLEESSLEKIDSSILELNEEEKTILEELYRIQQELNELEIQEIKLETEIISLLSLIEGIEENISFKTISYNDNLSIMDSVLKSYQKNGALNSLQLILSSDSLQTLLRRINAIRDISKNTSSLLDRINEEKEILINEKLNLDNNLMILDKSKKELKITIESKLLTRTSLENRLSELMDERDRFTTYLDDLNYRWKESKPIFESVIGQLIQIVESGDLPEELIQIKFGIGGIYGTISDHKLNLVLLDKDLETPLLIFFNEDNMSIKLDELQLEIYGSLELMDEHNLRFNMESGQYMGLNLQKSSLDELFDFGYLDLKFAKLLGKNTIRSVNIKDSYLELNIKPALF